MKTLIIGVQDKLSSLFENARVNPEVDGNTETWPRIPAPQTQNPSTQLAMSLNASNTNHRLLRNSPETNDRTITLDTSRSNSERSNAAKLKEEITNVMQAQFETKDCKIQHVRILPGEKVEICMETDSQCENARHYPRWLELAMPGARMKGQTWFPIKCDNVPKSQVMKEGSLGTALKDDLLPAFKEDNEREGCPDMTAKKVVWISKVFDRPMGSLVIWLKKEAARDLLLREQVAMFGELELLGRPYTLSEKSLNDVSTVTPTAICNPAVQNQRPAEFARENTTLENVNIWTNPDVLHVKALIVLQTLDAKNT